MPALLKDRKHNADVWYRVGLEPWKFDHNSPKRYQCAMLAHDKAGVRTEQAGNLSLWISCLLLTQFLSVVKPFQVDTF